MSPMTRFFFLVGRTFYDSDKQANKTLAKARKISKTHIRVFTTFLTFKKDGYFLRVMHVVNTLM